MSRYYPALKSLEQLEHNYLPQVARYRFTNHFRESIPKYGSDLKNLFSYFDCLVLVFLCRFRKQIQDSSMSELKDFLENVRKSSAKIGEVAMRHVKIKVKKIMVVLFADLFCLFRREKK